MLCFVTLLLRWAGVGTSTPSAPSWTPTAFYAVPSLPQARVSLFLAPPHRRPCARACLTFTFTTCYDLPFSPAAALVLSVCTNAVVLVRSFLCAKCSVFIVSLSGSEFATFWRPTVASLSMRRVLPSTTDKATVTSRRLQRKGPISGVLRSSSRASSESVLG